MGFDARQKKALRAKLRYGNVRTRVHNGLSVHYIEGWQAIAEANRIFGPENWDRETRSPACIWSERQRGQLCCLYGSQVRITVRAGDTIIVRDGVGTGFGRAAAVEAAHEIAMKAAETDATKRALATFGNPFGLALYDKDLTNVTRPPRHDHAAGACKARPNPKVILVGRTGQQRQFGSIDDFVDAVDRVLSGLQSVEDVYAFWEANVANFTALLDRDPVRGRPAVDAITTKLKTRAQTLARAPADEIRAGPIAEAVSSPSRTASEPSTQSAQPPLARIKERRVRDASHLAFVARHSCLICGRRPAQAHHVRFAQPRALGMKVSDEFTVPLCVGHHDAVHRTGDERAWWAARQIDPLAVAVQLWTSSDKRAELPTPPLTKSVIDSDGDTPGQATTSGNPDIV